MHVYDMYPNIFEPHPCPIRVGRWYSKAWGVSELHSHNSLIPYFITFLTCGKPKQVILNTQSRDSVKTGWHKVHTKFKSSKTQNIILALPVDISFLDNKGDISQRYFCDPELSYTQDWLTKLIVHTFHEQKDNIWM